MDDYTREMMDLKTLVTRTLEKKGVLAKIRAELRANVFEAIEEEDRVVESEGLPPALLGSCNDRAKQLHASASGRLLTALVCEYLDWAQLNHTLKVYQPECNLQKDSWKSELKEFSSKNGYDLNRNGDSAPLLLDVLEGFLKYEVRYTFPFMDMPANVHSFLLTIVNPFHEGPVWYAGMEWDRNDNSALHSIPFLAFGCTKKNGNGHFDSPSFLPFHSIG